MYIEYLQIIDDGTRCACSASYFLVSFRSRRLHTWSVRIYILDTRLYRHREQWQTDLRTRHLGRGPDLARAAKCVLKAAAQMAGPKVRLPLFSVPI